MHGFVYRIVNYDRHCCDFCRTSRRWLKLQQQPRPRRAGRLQACVFMRSAGLRVAPGRRRSLKSQPLIRPCPTVVPLLRAGSWPWHVVASPGPRAVSFSQKSATPLAWLGDRLQSYHQPWVLRHSRNASCMWSLRRSVFAVCWQLVLRFERPNLFPFRADAA
jgi:hypothetical protein